VLGGSWGSTLALAYAEQHPNRVAELILFGVTTGRREEFDWLFRGGLAVLFPEQWERLRAAVPVDERDGDIVEAYHRLLNDPDPAVRHQAALAWCTWESATPAWPPTPGLSPRFSDPAFRMAFARLVTHYVRHNAWLEDGSLLRDADSLTPRPATNARWISTAEETASAALRNATKNESPCVSITSPRCLANASRSSRC
jgi:proline iminopeptidase